MTLSGDDHPATTIPVTRALRRSRGRWRLFAFVVLAIAVALAFVRLVPGYAGTGPAIARVTISGTIATDAARTELLDKLAKDDDVVAVIVAINSPGGTTAGGEELYETLRQLGEQKPVVATIGELGASAAYMGAVATDRIFARNLSIVGSIGVFYQHVDAGKLLDTIGVDLQKVASGTLKGRPDYNEPITPEVRASLEQLVDSSFQYFVDVVADRRALSRAQTLALADGRILSGVMAAQAGLVDAMGGQAEARQWLQTEHGIDTELAVLDVWPPRGSRGWLDFLLGAVAVALSDTGWQGFPLDGLVSLWHPSSR